jgi:hypothetical protein
VYRQQLAFYGATISNAFSFNKVISLISIVTPPLSYTTDRFSATKVETPVLQAGVISSDFNPSIPTLNIAEESRASTDIISIGTVVTASDTTADIYQHHLIILSNILILFNQQMSLS